MPTPISNGTREPILKRRSSSYDPKTGLVETHEYEGSGDSLNGLAAECIANKTPFTMTSSGRVSTISFSSPSNIGGGPELTPDGWQLLANELSVPISTHPKILALPETGPNSWSNAKTQADLHENGKTVKLTGMSGDSLFLYNELIRGTTHYPRGQYVLKHTTNVSNAYSANIADSRVEFVYTTAELVEEISDITLWTDPCPGRLILKIEAMEVQVPDSKFSVWGWRKLPSQETAAANNRIDISTEYWLGPHSRLLHAHTPDSVLDAPFE